jgi:ketosteroid isomerase-like protein
MLPTDVKRAVDEFVRALVNSDLPALMDCYDDEVVFQMPGAPTMIGKEAVEAHYRNVMGIGVAASTMTPQSVSELPGCVIEAGVYEMTLKPSGSPPVKDVGKYQVVYRQSGGKWRIWYDTVLSDSSATVGNL